MISVMIVAAITVHLGQGLLAPKGLEMPLLYGAVAFGLALTGFGEYSVDALVGVAGRWSAGFTWIVLMLGVVGAFANLAFRRRPITVSA
jgi:hypothetical protein